MHRHSPDWATHIPVLIRALELTRGPVLELGLGISSTPLMHMMCLDKGRKLVSYDHEQVFVDMFRKFRSPSHVIAKVDNWQWAPIEAERWAVALVDHKPDARRKEEVKRLLDADFVIIHDSQPEADDLYHYSEIYPLFKYRYNYTKAATHATVLSNRAPFYYGHY